MAEIPLPTTPFYSPSTQKFREKPDDLKPFKPIDLFSSIHVPFVFF